MTDDKIIRLTDLPHFTGAEAAARLTAQGIKISDRTVTRERDRGNLGFRRIGIKVYISLDQLEEYLQRGTVRCHPKNNLFASPDEGKNTGSRSELMAVVPTGTSLGMMNKRDRRAAVQRARRNCQERKKP